LRVFYSCPLQEKVVKASNSYKYRYDKNPPVPYIFKISRYGEVKIRFTAEMEPKALLKETEIYSPGRLLNGIALGDVFGLSTSTFTNFTLIHNSTVQINGTTYPSLSVAIRPLDPEDTCSTYLDFIWRCIDYTSEELTLQLDFTTP